jgi:uncharacterized membrane protein
LPSGMGRLQRLELLRVSANHFEQVEDVLPDEVLALPRLAWLAHAGNPFSAAREQAARRRAAAAPIPWAELQLSALLGEGASGHIHAARWQPAHGPAEDVAVKLFKGAVTSDGLPQCEMAASLAAGEHAHLVGVRGVLADHPQGTSGLVLPRLAAHWAPLAGPPSMASCTRDVYRPGLRLPRAQARAIAHAATAALGHLHARGLGHGDLYAHNLLVDGQGGALLSDFGAAAFLPVDDAARTDALQALDRRALQVLVDELSQHSDAPWCAEIARPAPACRAAPSHSLNDSPMQGTLRRIVYVALYEAIAIVMASIGLMLMSGAGVFDSGVLAAVTSAIAVAWNGVFNALFERWEARQQNRERTLGRRIVHALGFELGLVVFLVPLMAWWLDVSLWQALVMDLSLVVFFLVYTFVFTWAFDAIFGPPSSAMPAS